MNPNQNSLTRDPTRIRSHNPKPDPRAEKRTRPIPICMILQILGLFLIQKFKIELQLYLILIFVKYVSTYVHNINKQRAFLFDFYSAKYCYISLSFLSLNTSEIHKEALMGPKGSLFLLLVQISTYMYCTMLSTTLTILQFFSGQAPGRPTQRPPYKTENIFM